MKIVQMPYKKIQKIFAKKKIYIDFLGASATEGEGLENAVEFSYPMLWTKEMEKIYFSKKFVVRNLAQSGTTASHGLFTAEELIRGRETDIVFLEYALNDEITPFSVDVYESLVRKLSGYSEELVVIPVILPIRGYDKNGYYMVEIAKHYHLPWLDIGDILQREIGKGNMKWEDYSMDDTHPSKQGHAWIAQNVLKLFQMLLQPDTREIENAPAPFECYFRNTYEKIQIKSFSEPPSFPIEFTLECSCFWVLYRKHYDARCGTLQVYWEQGLLTNLYGYSMFCWDFYFPEKIWENKQKEKHTFRLKMLPQDEKKEFIIKAIGWC